MKLKPHWQILIALISATLLALAARYLARDAAADSGKMIFIHALVRTAGYIGNLFMLALKMIIVPLVASSIIAGIASLHGVKGFGRLLGKTMALYMITGVIAIFIGLSLVNIIRPGLQNGKPNEAIAAAFHHQASQAAAPPKVLNSDALEGGFIRQMAVFFERMIPENIFTAAADNGNLLALIFFCILFGVAMTALPHDRVRPLTDVFNATNDAMIVLTNWIMVLTPIGVFGLILPVVYESGGGLFIQLGKYFVTVLLALSLHLFLVMPVITGWLSGRNGWSHLKHMREALFTAFSTASSSATLPVTMRCTEENAGVSKKVSGFTLPLGATVNMNGTALYECVAVIFVAQVMGMHLGFGQQLIIVLSALLTSVGVAGIPSASMVAILIILKNSAIPNAEVAIAALLSVDRLLDMSRTAVNIYGDSCVALIVDCQENEREQCLAAV